MADYILRDDAIKAITALSTPYVECFANPYYGAVKAVKNVPAADVRPVVRGEWIEHNDDFLGLTYECSVCHAEGMMHGNFCPNCGANMMEEK